MVWPPHYTPSVRTAHEATCTLHRSKIYLCHAQNANGFQCLMKANTFRKYDKSIFALPVCKNHKHVRLAAARCTTTELCGRPCARLAPYVSGNPVCHKHQVYQRPCHFMRLPAEIRVMIYENLFPPEIPSSRVRASTVNTAILGMNSTIRREASEVLYEKRVFTANIDAEDWYFLNARWMQPSFMGGSNAILSPCIARIRNIRVILDLEHDDCDDMDLNHGEYSTYAARTSVRNFVETLQTAGVSLKKVTVVPELRISQMMSAHGLLASFFVVIEPITSMPVAVDIEDRQSLKYSTPRSLGPLWQDQHIDANEDNFAKAIAKCWLKSAPVFQVDQTFQSFLGKFQDMCAKVNELLLAQAEEEPMDEYDKWHQPRWADVTGILASPEVERACHLYRVGVENQDMAPLTKVKEALRRRCEYVWWNYPAALAYLFDDFEAVVPRHLAPVIFSGEGVPLLEDLVDWDDMDMDDNAPGLDEPGVTVQHDGLRVKISRRGKTDVRWKSPAIMRGLRRIGQ